MWRAASAMARGVRGSSGWVSTARWSHAGAETSDAAEAAVEEVEIVEVPQALPADFVRAVLSVSSGVPRAPSPDVAQWHVQPLEAPASLVACGPLPKPRSALEM